MRILILLILVCLPCHATTWYVRPGVFDSNGGSFPCNPVPRASVYGSQDGTSYANAWNGLTAIQYGPSAVTNGDTVYVCGTHIYPMSFTGFTPYQAVAPIQCSNVTFRLDYATDPGTIFGGVLDRINNYTWFGPDANGVYWTTNAVISSNAKEIQFEILNSTNIVRLGHMTNSTWTGSLGSQAFIGGTNFIKTIDGSAPSTNLAVNGLGWCFDLYLSSNTVMQGGTWISSPLNRNRSDNDKGTLIGYYSTNMLGPQSIHYTNCNLYNGSGLDLYPGYNFWTVSGCAIKDSQYGVYGFYDSKAYTATNVTVTGCDIEGIDTTNYPHIDGHAICARDGCNWVVTHNTIVGACTSIDFFVDSTHTLSNNTIAWNYIRDSHINTSGQSGDGIVIEGTTTSGLAISNRVYGNILVNIGTNATTATQGAGVGWGPSDYSFIVGNTMYNCYSGISMTPAGTALNVTAEDNIIVNPRFRYWTLTGTGTATLLQLDYNCYYPAANSSDSGFSLSPSATHDTHAVFSNPSFASASPTVAADFRLNTGSPAIGAGTPVGISTDFGGNSFNNPPAIGAWETVLQQFLIRVGNMRMAR